MHVLLIEDNPDARDSLAMLLKIWGHQVEVAADGAVGLLKGLAQQPEVAVVDIGLPVLRRLPSGHAAAFGHGQENPPHRANRLC